MKIVIWNTEWASPHSRREKIITDIVRESTPDIICITEGYIESWQDFGYVISSTEDYGYKITKGRRKVILISKERWESVDAIGSAKMPAGRFVSGRTQGVDVFGVCIPWKDAHVRTGRKDRQPWEDHIAYLNGLGEILPSGGGKTAVMGDFNQRIPRKYTRQDAFDLMVGIFDEFRFETKGDIQPINKLTIDHLCTKNTGDCLSVEAISNFQDDIRLSDHFGLSIEI